MSYAFTSYRLPSAGTQSRLQFEGESSAFEILAHGSMLLVDGTSEHREFFEEGISRPMRLGTPAASRLKRASNFKTKCRPEMRAMK
jgi:hypothetical protein